MKTSSRRRQFWARFGTGVAMVAVGVVLGTTWSRTHEALTRAPASSGTVCVLSIMFRGTDDPVQAYQACNGEPVQELSKMTEGSFGSELSYHLSALLRSRGGRVESCGHNGRVYSCVVVGP